MKTQSMIRMLGFGETCKRALSNSSQQWQSGSLSLYNMLKFFCVCPWLVHSYLEAGIGWILALFSSLLDFCQAQKWFNRSTGICCTCDTFYFFFLFSTTCAKVAAIFNLQCFVLSIFLVYALGSYRYITTVEVLYSYYLTNQHLYVALVVSTPHP